MFDLVIQGGKQNGKRFSLPENKTIVVGRDESCQLVLNSSLVSRKHCELKQTTEGIWATDLKSQNGTHINEIPITEPTLLARGDVLRIGPLILEVQRKAAPAAPAPAPVPAVTIPPKARKDPGLSDDEIAAWLGEGETNSGKSLQDTAVYDAPPPAVVAAAAAVPAHATKPALAGPAPSTKKFRSVKEEAAEIIRRHWAKVRGTTPQE